MKPLRFHTREKMGALPYLCLFSFMVNWNMFQLLQVVFFKLFISVFLWLPCYHGSLCTFFFQFLISVSSSVVVSEISCSCQGATVPTVTARTPTATRTFVEALGTSLSHGWVEDMVPGKSTPSHKFVKANAHPRSSLTFLPGTSPAETSQQVLQNTTGMGFVICRNALILRRAHE